MFDHANVDIARQLTIQCLALLHNNQYLQVTHNHKIFTAIINFVTLQWVFVVLIYLYRWIISPVLPKTCIYHPTCSSYAIQAIRNFGTIRGVVLTTQRILRCHPFAIGGVDRLPDNINGVIKWLL